MCHVWSWVWGFHLVLLFVSCYHSRIPFLDTKMVGNLDKSSKSVRFTAIFLPSFLILLYGCPQLCIGWKRKYVFLKFLNPSQSSYTILVYWYFTGVLVLLLFFFLSQDRPRCTKQWALVKSNSNSICATRVKIEVQSCIKWEKKMFWKRNHSK